MTYLIARWRNPNIAVAKEQNRVGRYTYPYDNIPWYRPTVAALYDLTNGEAKGGGQA